MRPCGPRGKDRQHGQLTLRTPGSPSPGREATRRRRGAGAAAPAPAAPHFPLTAAGPGRRPGGPSRPGQGVGAPGGRGRGWIGQRLPGEAAATGRRAPRRARRSPPGRGERGRAKFPAGAGRLLPPPIPPHPEAGREEAAAAAAFREAKAGLPRAALCFPEGGCRGGGRRGRSRLHPRAGGGPSTAPTCRREGGRQQPRPASVCAGRASPRLASPRLRPGQSRRRPLPAAPVLGCSSLAARATSGGILERLRSRVPFHLSQPAPLSYLQPFPPPPLLLPGRSSFSPPSLPVFCLPGRFCFPALSSSSTPFFFGPSSSSAS